MNKSCAHCGGPMPERISPLGRPPVYCTITCRRNADYVRTSRRLEEEHRAAMELRCLQWLVRIRCSCLLFSGEGDM